MLYIISFFQIYFAVGFILQFVFHFYILKKIDESLVNGNVGFKLIITPGLIALWPLVMILFFRKNKNKYQNENSTDLISMQHSIIIILSLVVFPVLLALISYNRFSEIPEENLPVLKELKKERKE